MDETATGSANPFHSRPSQPARAVVARWKNPHSTLRKRKRRNLRQRRSPAPCRARAHPLGCLLHRARSASRSKRLPGAVPARGRFPGSVDESETGSVNEKAAFRGGLFICSAASFVAPDVSGSSPPAILYGRRGSPSGGSLRIGRTSSSLRRTEKSAKCNEAFSGALAPSLSVL